jgi:hypothetical protein
VARVADEAGPDRVPEHVQDRVPELPLVSDRLGAESALEEVAHAAVAEVVPLRMAAVEELNAAREAGLSDLDDEVDVIRHLDGAMDTPAVTACRFAQRAVVGAVVLGVLEDEAPVDATGVDVVVAIRELRAKRPRHLQPD